ncbi:MAG: hypothetical protein ACOH2M_17150 [Cypionkella sp.]
MRSSISKRLSILERLPLPAKDDTRTWRQVLKADPAAWKQCMQRQKEDYVHAR